MSRTGTLRFSEADLAEHKARAHRFYDDTPQRLVVPERDVLPAVMAALRLHPAVAWIARLSSGAGVVIRPKVFKQLVAQGHLNRSDGRYMRFGFAGASDVVGQLRASHGGRFLGCEVKREGERPNDEQAAFLDAVNGAGGVGFVARQADDVFKALA